MAPSVRTRTVSDEVWSHVVTQGLGILHPEEVELQEFGMVMSSIMLVPILTLPNVEAPIPRISGNPAFPNCGMSRNIEARPSYM